MKTSKFFLTAAGLSFLAVSCAKEVAPAGKSETGNSLVINAVMGVKTSFAGLDEANNHIVAWNEGDVITVFDTEGNAYVSEGCEGGVSTSFTVNDFPSGKTPAYAIYSGANPSDSWSSGKINTVAKSSQTVTADGNFSNGSSLCTGAITFSEDKYTLEMHHITGLLKIKVDMDNVASIKVAGSGANDVIAGSISVTPGAVPSFEVVSGVKSVDLNCQIEGAKTFTKGKEYYICALPGTISNPVITVTNKFGNTVKLVRSSAVEVKRGEISNIGTLSGLSWDLSAPGYANCYIVRCGGKYKFTPTQGCSGESVGEIASVDLLWETADKNADEGINVHDVIKTVGFSDDYVTFETADSYRSGNALVAAKDADGTILWSWHIWLMDKDTNLSDVQWGSMVLMDRSLGDVKNTGTPRSSMLYQWGRKDPFPGGRGDGKMIAVAGTATSYAKAQGDVAKSIKNPTIVYGVLSTSSAGAQPCGLNCGDEDMWGAKGDKTKYDPCPYGYRVPVSDNEAGDIAASKFAEFNKNPKWYASDDGDHKKNTFEIALNSGVITKFGRSASIKLNTKKSEYSKCKYELQYDGTAFYMWTANSLAKRRGVCIRCSNSSSGASATLQATTSDGDATYNSKNNGYTVRCERIAVTTKSSESLSKDAMSW